MRNKIYSINGPIVTTLDTESFSMLEMVHVGKLKLLGEVIGISDKETTIQVYESTTGLKTNDLIYGSGSLLCAQLGPGLLKNIFDGIERPLMAIKENQGAFIHSGFMKDAIDSKKLWEIKIEVKIGDIVNAGQIFARCKETDLIEHRSLIPYDVSGEVVNCVSDGEYTINDTIIQVKDDQGNIKDVTLSQKWPIRKPRPIQSRKAIELPLITGQRVIDTLFPIAKGGSAAVPGGFGAGKTMTQHQIAKWCDADIIVYVGCGERGNEMTQVLTEFSELIDPKSNKPLLDRTILIANTSNMPVAAREASIYTGITLAEYYRDMGYHVAVMADSTSRWAEALREISGRLEEMPAEEGFPAYLPSRISAFYERAGYVNTLSNSEGSVTIIGAVSPQGADFSEPVTQNTKRFVRTFWALDKSLAYARHYPAINWNTSYSDYLEDLIPWYDNNVDAKFKTLRDKIVQILHEENKLMEIVKLIGADVLPDYQKLVLEISRVIRVGYLQQNAFHSEDTFVPFNKQFKMLQIIDYLFESCKKLIEKKIAIRSIYETGIFDLLIKIKYDVPNNKLEILDEYYQKIDQALQEIE
ncbi:MAG: V-type ATP synthase subunit A [Anaerorhabdus sp.]